MTIGIRTTRPGASAIKWLLFFALAWSQVSYAAHQHEHALEESAEACIVCLKYDSSEDAVCDSGIIGVPRAAAITDVIESSGPELATGTSTYKARAPPVHPKH